MTKLFRLLSMTFIAVIVFCYGMNILLTNQVNTINTQQSSIAIRAFDTATTELTMPPWYNPILSGHHPYNQ